MKRLLIAGDTHGIEPERVPHIHWLCNEARIHGADRIFVVGDFGAFEHLPEGRRWFDDIQDAAEDYDLHVYWLDGNHDKTSLVLKMYSDNRDHEGFLMCRERIHYAPRGHRWTWDGVRFIALGGAYSVDKAYRLAQEAHDAADFGMDPSETAETWWFPEEEMTDADMRQFLADPTPVDVMLSHDKPRSSNAGIHLKNLPECWQNQDRIQRAVVALQPKILVHGHLHFRYDDHILCGDGKYTHVIGLDCDPYAASRMDPKKSRIIIDLDRDKLWD